MQHATRDRQHATRNIASKSSAPHLRQDWEGRLSRRCLRDPAIGSKRCKQRCAALQIRCAALPPRCAALPPRCAALPPRRAALPPGCASRQRHGQVKTITNIPIQPNIVQLEFSLEQIEKSGECPASAPTQRNAVATRRNADLQRCLQRFEPIAGSQRRRRKPALPVLSQMWRRAFACNVACCPLHVACCMVPVACCMSSVACRLVPVACCPFHAACCELYVARRRVPALHAEGDQRPAAVAARLHPRQARTGLTPATSAPRLGSPLPHATEHVASTMTMTPVNTGDGFVLFF